MFKTKKAFGSLSISLAIHFIGFAILGLIFLKAKPYEEYIETMFLEPLPQKRKTRMRDVVIKPIRSEYGSSATAKQLPQVTTAVKISDIDRGRFGLGTTTTTDAPLSVASAVYESPAAIAVTASQSVRPKFNSSSFKQTVVSPAAKMNILSPANIEGKHQLPSIPSIDIRQDNDVNALRQYCEIIKQKIEEEKEYPGWAERNGYEGQVEIRFKLLADGQVENVEIVSPSGYEILDNEAVRTIQASAPFPPIPKAVAKAHLWIKLPVIFELQ